MVKIPFYIWCCLEKFSLPMDQLLSEDSGTVPFGYWQATKYTTTWSKQIQIQHLKRSKIFKIKYRPEVGIYQRLCVCAGVGELCELFTWHMFDTSNLTPPEISKKEITLKMFNKNNQYVYQSVQ